MTPAEQDILGSRQEESESEDDLVDEDSSSSGCEADMVRCCARSCEVVTIYFLVKSCEVFTIYYLVMFFSSVCISTFVRIGNTNKYIFNLYNYINFSELALTSGLGRQVSTNQPAHELLARKRTFEEAVVK